MKYSSSHYAEALYESLEGKQGNEYTTCIHNFVHMLRKNKDFKSLPSILNRYEKIFLKKRGLKKIEVESASPLDSSVKKNIEEYAGGNVLISEKVNSSLLAGITLLINDTLLIDASGKTRINSLFSHE